MTAISPEARLADLVTARPELAGRLDELGLDYCCGGAQTLSTAVAESGLDLASTITSLEAVEVDPTEAVPTWDGIDGLVDLIESTHHAYLRRVLPGLVELADKVATVHGERHPELVEVRAHVHAIRADLEPHLAKEERVLFPMVRELAAATSVPSFHCGSLANPIRVMLGEHDQVGTLLARLRDVTGGYVVPDDGCASYRALYAGLVELEADTHRHVHLENNVLFPEVLAVERGMSRAADADQGGEAPCWAHLLEPRSAADGS